MKATTVAFGAVIYVAAAGLIFGGGCLAQPETVEGLVKRDSNKEAWKVPIVAKQPNENKPTQVLGNYPELSPDTLARPLKKNQGRLPFSQFLAAASKEEATKRPSSSATIPNHILQWLSQRQKAITTSSPQPSLEAAAKKTDPQVWSSQPRFGVEKVGGGREEPEPVAVTKDPHEAEEKQARTTMKPRLLIQRPSYNPQLAVASSTDNEVVGENTEEEDETVTLNPRVAAIIMDDFMERQKDKLSVAGLVIGLTFVAAFIAIAIGLVGHGLVKRCRNSHPSGDSGFSGRSSRNSWMRSPGDEDQTPPELRPGSQSGHPGYSNNNRRRSSGRTRHIPGTLPGHSGTPFFNGKLILHDPPGLNTNGARGGTTRPFNTGNILAMPNGSGCYPGAMASGFTLTSPPSKLGAIPKKMPSKAAQVTDILVSPKYEDVGGDTTEEEDSDDTVYECPGLAATKGTALEVRNPFFLEDCDLQSPATGRLANKKPISQYTDLFHHQEIASLN